MFMHLDFDAFYCGVEQVLNPALKDKPFIIAQKNCAATTSYAARRLGVKKLSRVNDVMKNFPQVAVVNGEDLTKYKAEGQRIFEYLRDQVVPDSQVERIGMEEIRINLQSLIDYNLVGLKKIGIGSLKDLNEFASDPGFEELMGDGWKLSLTLNGTSSFDCPDFFFNYAGNVPQSLLEKVPADLCVTSLHLYVASHISHYIMQRLYMEQKYSISVGCAANPAMAKIICGERKPLGLAILEEEFFQDHLDQLYIRQIPGFGRKIACDVAKAIFLRTGNKYKEMDPSNESIHFVSSDDEETAEPTAARDLKVHYVRGVIPLKGGTNTFYSLFGPKLAEKLWALLHGKLETSPEGQTSGKEYPKTISVEDTHPGLQKNPIRETILLLSERLLNQLENACYDSDNEVWKARPTHIKLSIRQMSDPYPQRRSKTVRCTHEDLKAPRMLEILRPMLQLLLKKGSPLHLLNIALCGIIKE